MERGCPGTHRTAPIYPVLRKPLHSLLRLTQRLETIILCRADEVLP